MIITCSDKNIFAFADTHGRHKEVEIPDDIDILICAGDVCNAGDEMQLQDFYRWFAGQPAKHKLFVPGNHDLPFEFAPEYAASRLPKAITCIEQGGIVWEGIRLFVLPARMGLSRETAPRSIPSNIDLLVTHCPPKGVLDDNGRWGCPILRELIDNAEPKMHVFGHCHQTAGQTLKIGQTEFYNVGIEAF
jgi:Icc-related predicted phosphoesterase